MTVDAPLTYPHTMAYAWGIHNIQMTKSVAGVCFRTNRSCRQGPAHQGMKIGTAHTPLDSGPVSGYGAGSSPE